MAVAVIPGVEQRHLVIEMELGYNTIGPETHRDLLRIGDAEKSLLFRLEQTAADYFALEVFAEGFVGDKLIFRIAGPRDSVHLLPEGRRCRLSTDEHSGVIICVFYL